MWSTRDARWLLGLLALIGLGALWVRALSFTLRRTYWKGNRISLGRFLALTRPVDYAHFMRLHGHPFESWTPRAACAEELTRNLDSRRLPR